MRWQEHTYVVFPKVFFGLPLRNTVYGNQGDDYKEGIGACLLTWFLHVLEMISKKRTSPCLYAFNRTYNTVLFKEWVRFHINPRSYVQGSN